MPQARVDQAAAAMLVGPTIAAVALLGAVGFAGGYAVGGLGKDEDSGKPPARRASVELPAVKAPASAPRIVSLGAAPALPRPKRSRARSNGPSSTPSTPEAGATPDAQPPANTPAPTSAPTSAPTAAPTAAPPDPDDIIEG